jgi:hypothetical protein
MRDLCLKEVNEIIFSSPEERGLSNLIFPTKLSGLVGLAQDKQVSVRTLLQGNEEKRNG